MCLRVAKGLKLPLCGSDCEDGLAHVSLLENNQVGPGLKSEFLLCLSIPDANSETDQTGW